MKKIKKIIKFGILNIDFRKNNIIINISDLLGNTLGWISAGLLGFKGAEKKSLFVIQTVAEKTASKLLSFGIKKLKIIIRGNLFGRENYINILKNTGVKVISLEDKTPVIYNGCRPPKKRRL